MRWMRRYTKSNNIVFFAILLEFVWVVTFVPIKDQEAINTQFSGRSKLFKMTNPIYGQFIRSPAILRDSSPLTGWEFSFVVPGIEVIFPRNNDKWRDRVTHGIDGLDYCNPFPITRLYLLCFRPSVRTCHDYSRWNNAYYKSSLVKIINIYILNPILRNYLLYKYKPALN